MMSTNRQFNIRVYGIWRHGEQVLLSEESIRGRQVLKFPGGGLEFGEGTIDCLRREWQEELGLQIEVLEHIYTTDYFQPSFFDAGQIISIYYLVRPLEPLSQIANLLPDEQIRWIDVKSLCGDIFTLPIDAKVGEMLREHWCS